MRLILVLVQSVLLILVAVGIGYAHSRVAPIKTRIEAPPSLPEVAGTAPVAPPTKTPDAAPPGQPPSAPAAGPAASPPRPADAGGEVIPQALRDRGHITLSQAKVLYDAGAQFIDTRRKEDYEAGHIKNAWGIPLAAFHGKVPRLAEQFDRSETIVAYCVGGDCEESEQVAMQFQMMGFKKTYVIHAGYPGWEKAGLPTEGGPGVQEDQ